MAPKKERYGTMLINRLGPKFLSVDDDSERYNILRLFFKIVRQTPFYLTNRIIVR